MTGAGTGAGPPGHPALPPERQVALPGRGVVRVREQGGPPEAPALVLLHGLTCTADLNWFGLFDALGPRARVVAADQRGHGGGIQPARYRIEDAADDTAALVDALGLGPVVLVGFSLGGSIAQQVWRRRPDLVAGMVLVASAADHRPPGSVASVLGGAARSALAGLGRVLPGRLRAAAVAALRGRADARSRPDDDTGDLQAWAALELAKSDPFQVASASAALRRSDTSGWVGEVDVPVAVVVTTADDVVPTDRQRALAAAIPGASTEHIVGGHGAFVEDVDAFVPPVLAAVDQVLARLRSARS